MALLSVRRETRWEHLDSLARAIIAGPDTPDAPGSPEHNAGDLFSLAQTVAVLTNGIVSIEDTSSRVLAYSRSSDSDEVDDLRRLSILGWQGPEPYLSKLREWGVFQHLRTSDTVIAVDPHPELGLRRRLAIGIRTGAQPLGTIWVQEGSRPLAPLAEQALVGAARVAAPSWCAAAGSCPRTSGSPGPCSPACWRAPPARSRWPPTSASTCGARPPCWRTARAPPSSSPGPR